MLLRQLSYAINQLKAPKAPTRGISCLSLVLYGIRELAKQHYEPLILLQSEIITVVLQAVARLHPGVLGAVLLPVPGVVPDRLAHQQVRHH